METVVKVGFAQISLAAQKNLSYPKFGREGSVAASSPPPMGAITCFSNQTQSFS